MNEKLADYEERLKTTPIVQSEYQKIARGYDNAKIKFNELKNKQIDARISQELEGGDSAEQFVLASSAFLPRLPESPNRVGIILLGLFFGMLSGLAMVVLFEHLDKTIRNARMIYNVVGVQPLATIPEFNT